MQTYLISGVVMDIAAFKVSYSIGCDIDTTALRAARARSASIGANSYSILRTREAALRQFSGAMDECSGELQAASTH